MSELTANGGVGIAFFAPPLDEPLNFLHANFSDRQALAERVELVHAQEALFSPALFSLSMVDARRCLSAVIVEQDALEVFVTNAADLGGKKPLALLDHSAGFEQLPVRGLGIIRLCVDELLHATLVERKIQEFGGDFLSGVVL